MNKGREVGGDGGDDYEYDPERRMEGLVEAVKVVGAGAGGAGVDRRGENIFSTTEK